MCFPNHPTSNIEDAFFSNSPDYLPASSDYVPASPGKIYSSFSNSFGLVPIASPTISLLHDDPYMKLNSNKLVLKSPNFKESKWEVTIRLLLLALDFPTSNKSLKKSKLVTKLRQLVVDNVTTALEIQAATMVNVDNANRNPEPKEAHYQESVATKSSLAANLLILKVQKVLLDLSAALSVLNQCFPVAIVPKTTSLLKLKFKKLNFSEDFKLEEVIEVIAQKGCFELVNHGISSKILWDVKECGKGAFALENERKRVVLRSNE
nr:1-aminocyclopropane-1-carboxylate oxidase 5-like [Tanacetum cinerariifolium]